VRGERVHCVFVALGCHGYQDYRNNGKKGTLEKQALQDRGFFLENSRKGVHVVVSFILLRFCFFPDVQ
jgi:hypothetical protein